MDAETVATLFVLGLAVWHMGRAALRHVVAWALAGPAEEDAAAVSYAPPPPDYGAALDAAPMLADAPLSAAEWLRLLNDERDFVPHLAICGPSGSGKSTLALALIGARAGELVICTPKNAADDPWGGFPAVRLVYGADGEPSFAAIGDAIEAVYRELNARNMHGDRPRAPLTLVVDELTSVLWELRGRDLQARLIRLWLMGRSVNIRLVTMDPTVNVKGWGIEGRGDVRESIAFIRAERDKSAQLGELDEVRTAQGVALDTAQVPALAARGLDPSRVWVPDAAQAAAPVAQAAAPVAQAAAPAAQAAAPVAQAPRDPARFHAPTAPDPTPHEAALVAQWAEEDGMSLRALARQLYRARGGDDPAYRGDGGPFYAVKAALAAPVVAETL